MPSGSVPLLEASRVPDNLLAQGVVEVIIQESPLLEMLPFITIDGESYVTRHEVDLAATSFRQVNAGYTRTHGTYEKNHWGVTILGGEVFVDNFIVRTRPADGTKARQFKSIAKHAALTFDKQAVVGDGSSNTFKGFDQLISEGFGQIQTNNAGTPAALTQADLDAAIDLCRVKTPDVILGNRTHRRRITTLGRTGATYYSQIDVGNDAFGRQVTMYNGLPIRILGDDADGNLILPFSKGAGSEAYMYILAFGDEDNIYGLMGAGGMIDVVDFGETEAAPGHMGRIEFYPGLVCADKYALVRIDDILAA